MAASVCATLAYILRLSRKIMLDRKLNIYSNNVADTPLSYNY